MNADYPGALWMPAHPSNFRAGRMAAVGLLVLHCTDGHADARPVAEMWQRPAHGSSAHFVIGQDGTVIQAVRLADVAWHAHVANGHSVGIEHCARTPRELGPNDPGMPPTEAQLTASAKLVDWLCARFGMPRSRAVIVGHAEADPATTHADCPEGSGLKLQDIVERVIALSA